MTTGTGTVTGCGAGVTWACGAGGSGVGSSACCTGGASAGVGSTSACNSAGLLGTGFFVLACAISGKVSVVFSGTLDSAGLANTDNSVAARRLRDVVMALEAGAACAA